MSLRQGLSAISQAVLAILRTRLEIFALEASQQKANLLALFALFAAALLFSTLAILVFSLFIALLFWPTDYRYWAIGGLMALYALLALWAGLKLLRKLNHDPLPFATTLEELGRDLKMLERLRAESKDEL